MPTLTGRPIYTDPSQLTFSPSDVQGVPGGWIADSVIYSYRKGALVVIKTSDGRVSKLASHVLEKSDAGPKVGALVELEVRAL